eukprot:RCo018296
MATGMSFFAVTALLLLTASVLLMAPLMSPSCSPPADSDPDMSTLAASLAKARSDIQALLLRVQGLNSTARSLRRRAHQHQASPLAIPPSAVEVETRRTPFTLAEVLQRVRPSCRDLVRQKWAKQRFSSQYSQDWFLLVNYFLALPGPGFYLDVGANEPKRLSNTWFLDTCMGWKGVCVEPDPGYAERLRQERTCHVVNHCVDSEAREVELQAAGTAIGHVVDLSPPSRNPRQAAEQTRSRKAIRCVTLHSIMAEQNVTHVDFFSLDVEDFEPRVLATFPEEAETGISIDVILMENEKTSKEFLRCHHPNLLRYPFWNRGYALVGFFGAPQGDDLWVKADKAHLWRSAMVYPEKMRKYAEASQELSTMLSREDLTTLRQTLSTALS